MAKNDPYISIKDMAEAKKKLWPIPEIKCCRKNLVFEYPKDTAVCAGCGREYQLCVSAIGIYKE